MRGWGKPPIISSGSPKAGVQDLASSSLLQPPGSRHMAYPWSLCNKTKLRLLVVDRRQPRC